MTPWRWLALAAAALWLGGCGDDGGSGGAGGGDGGSSGSMGSGGDVHNELGKPQFGDPRLASIQRIAFGPGGVLLVGDGAKDRVVAIETGDTDGSQRAALAITRVDGVSARVANAIGGDVAPDQIFITDIATNPLTGRTFIAAEYFAEESTSRLFWVGADGEVHPVDLTQVIYASFGYPPVQTPGSVVTGMAWLGDFVAASALKSSAQVSHVVLAPTPIEHDGLAQHLRPNIYHPGAMQPLSDIAIGALFGFPGSFGEPWMGLCFSGAPIAKYDPAQVFGGPVQQLGRTQLDIGPGREVREAVYHGDDDDGWLVLSIFNLQFDGQVLGARIHRSFLLDATLVDANAPLLFDLAGLPTRSGVDRLVDLDGAEHLTLDGDAVIMLRQDTLLHKPLPPASAP